MRIYRDAGLPGGRENSPNCSSELGGRGVGMGGVGIGALAKEDGISLNTLSHAPLCLPQNADPGGNLGLQIKLRTFFFFFLPSSSYSKRFVGFIYLFICF